MCTRASYARSTRVGRIEFANARATWEQNSTEIPRVMTRFTSESAFSGTDQKNINPNMLTIIIAMVMIMTTEVQMSNPSRTIVTRKIAPPQTNKLYIVSYTIVRYCS